MSVKVMSYNLRIDVKDDPYQWKDRKTWIPKLILKYRPDIIGTQEVMPHMLDDLKETLSEEYATYGFPISEGNHTEIGVIFVKRSLFEIKDKGFFMISETPNVPDSKGWDAEFKRSCSWVEVVDTETKKSQFRVFNTHLDHMGEKARSEGSKVLISEIEKLNEVKPLPYILTGDFNSTPESGWLDTLFEKSFSNSHADLLKYSNPKELATFHFFKGNIEGSPIDYIFASEPLKMSQTQIIRDRIDNGYPSDHYPVMSKIK